MTVNLLPEIWTNIDSYELRLVLDAHIGGPGQYNDCADKLYLPLAGPSCRIKLIFREKKISAIEPGTAFDPIQWERIRKEVENSLLVGTVKVGREYSFSSYRVLGSWQGERSGVQILPPPGNAPRPHVEMADHPFILEFSIKGCNLESVTNHRRRQEHRNLTLLLNVLLAGRICLLPRQPQHFWAGIPGNDAHTEIKWVQQCFAAELGKAIIDQLSPPTSERLEEIDPEEYYKRVGHDGKGLRVPNDLDQSICLYLKLLPAHRAKFDRAIFWMDIASRQWNISVSASFATLVLALESLIEHGHSHEFECPVCGKLTRHEVPGATQRFKDFFEIYAPDATLSKLRNDMYSLRSGILHGSKLMQLDQDLAFGWDPPWWKERELHEELWSLSRMALRNWLKNPPPI